ncbi:MAG: hypothetical protein WCP97_06930 [bacterium]
MILQTLKKHSIPLGIIISATLYITILFLSQALKLSQLGLPFDDAWIHLQFAKNFINHGYLTFNPPEPSNGTTSLLWVFILSMINIASGKTISLVQASIGLGISFYVLTLILLYSILTNHFKFSTTNNVLLASTLSLTGPAVFLALSGLETTLFLSLCLLSIFLMKRNPTVTGITCGLAVAARPEGILLGIIIIIGFFIEKRSIKQKNILLFSLSFFSIVAIYLLSNGLLSGSLFPTTLAGRRFFWLGGQTGLNITRSFITFPSSWKEFITAFFLMNAVWSLDTTTQAVFNIFWILVAFGFVFSSLITAQGILKKKISSFHTLFMWFITHNLFYALILPTHGHAGRYQSLNILLIPILFAIGITYTAQQLVSNGKKILLAVTLFSTGILSIILPLSTTSPQDICTTNQLIYFFFLVFTIVLLVFLGIKQPTFETISTSNPLKIAFTFLVIIGCISTYAWSQYYTTSVAHINQLHIETGKYLAENTPSNAIIGAFDIGAISYFADRKIVDLGCLTDSKCLPYAEQQKLGEYLANQQVTYLAIPGDSLSEEPFDENEISNFKDFIGLLDEPSLSRKFILIPKKIFAYPRWVEHHSATWNARGIIGVYNIQSVSEKT